MDLKSIFNRAERLVNNQDVAEAIDLLKSVLGVYDEHPQALLMLANISAQKGSFSEAMDYFSRCEVKAPDMSVVFFHRARAFIGFGDLEKAIKDFKRATESDPTRFEYVQSLAGVLLRVGQLTSALDALSSAVGMAPNVAAVHGDRGVVLKRLGRLDEAVDAYQTAIDLDTNFAPAYANLSDAYLELGQPGQAVRYARKAVALLPRHPQSYLQLGVALKAFGSSAEAISAYERVIELDDRSYQAWMNLGNARRDTGELPLAQLAYKRAAALTPDSAQAHASIAAAALELGDPKEAARICDGFLTSHPQNGLVSACRLVVAATLGEKELCPEPKNLIGFFWPGIPDGYKSIDVFNDELCSYVCAHRSLSFAPTSHATRNAQHSGDLASPGCPAMAAFQVMVREALSDFLSTRIDDTYYQIPLHAPRLNAWGVIMRRGGHQVPHIHPTAWISGVYYPSVPNWNADNDNAGSIRFGEFGREFTTVAKAKTYSFLPETGQLVLFPSWLYHRTIPMVDNALRISIAFDFTLV